MTGGDKELSEKQFMSTVGSSKDPAEPEFWDVRYRQDFTPWEMGRVPSRLASYIGSLALPGKVLIPGCGTACEAGFLAENGWQVTAIDFSPSAVLKAKERLGNFDCQIMLADFLSYEEPDSPYDCIYERAFLCSLPPVLRTRYVEQCASLVRPGGILVGFFYVSPGSEGPPFPISGDELTHLMGTAFELLEDEKVNEDSLEIFGGKERWQVWRRYAY